MNFYLIGVDCKSAPLELREKIFRERRNIQDFWEKHSSQQAAILATCNRLEIYALAEDFSQARRSIDFFRQHFPEFIACGYVLFGEKEILQHILRLSCGLESQLKGELEIAQQLERWSSQDCFLPLLKGLVEKALFLGRQIRQQSGLNQPGANIATLVFDDLIRNLGQDDILKILVLGTGKIAELLFLCRPQNVYFYFAGYRNFERAKFLAQQAGGQAVPLKDIGKVIYDVDAVISATSSPHFLVYAKDLSVVSCRRKKPLLLYDLALPRDIEPNVGKLPGVMLKNLDDLGVVFEEYNFFIQDKIKLAEYLCSEAMKETKEKIYA